MKRKRNKLWKRLSKAGRYADWCAPTGNVQNIAMRRGRSRAKTLVGRVPDRAALKPVRIFAQPA
ncbi:MAG: hypothetical protein AMXMBFR4_21990 [Candidatus Hydrogenedentota bacterium]